MSDAPSPQCQPMAEEQRHDVIWLQAWCDGCDKNCWGSDGRQWCADDAWGGCEECERKPVKYVRDESHATLKARVEELELVLRQARAFLDPEIGPPGFGNREMIRIISAALPKQEPSQ